MPMPLPPPLVLLLSAQALLDDFLYACGTGLCSMRWCHTCPVCAAITSSVGTVEEIPDHTRCTLCSHATRPDAMAHINVFFFFRPDVVHVPTLTAKFSFPPELRQQLLEVHNVPPSAVGGYSFTVELRRGVYKVCARAYVCACVRACVCGVVRRSRARARTRARAYVTKM